MTDISQFFEEWKSMDCNLAALTLWNLQLFVGRFLLLRHSSTNVLGPNFKISSQFYFHCRKVILYIVLAALNFVDHVCIFRTKTLPSVMATQSGLSFTYLVKYLFLLLMLLFLVYFYIWAKCLIVHNSVNDFYFKVMLRSELYIGTKINFNNVLVHVYGTKCGLTISSSIFLNITCHFTLMMEIESIADACTTRQRFIFEVYGMPEWNINKLEWIPFRLCTFLLINLTFVIWNRETCQG